MGTKLMNYSSGDYKQRIGNPKRNIVSRYPNDALFSNPYDNLLIASFLAGGHPGGGSLLSMPSHYPPAMSAFRPPQRQQPQPPFLPLPNSMPLYHRNMNMITRTNSTPNYTDNNNNNIRLPATRLNKNVKNRGRDPSFTTKKTRSQKKESKKEERSIGPDPKDLPKDVILKEFSNNENSLRDDLISVDKFSGCVVFSPSPPPSSLPLPTFLIRPKEFSCYVR